MRLPQSGSIECAEALSGGSYAQTLSRGVRILELMAAVAVTRPGCEAWASVMAIFPADGLPDPRQAVPLLRAAADRIARLTSARMIGSLPL